MGGSDGIPACNPLKHPDSCLISQNQGKIYYHTLWSIQVIFLISLSQHFNNNVQFLSHFRQTHFKVGSNLVFHSHAF